MQAERGEPGFACRRWTWRDRGSAHACACGEGGAVIAPELATSSLHAAACPRGAYVRFIGREAGRLSAPQFRQLYEAEWCDANVLAVYVFDRAVHVDPGVRLDPALPVRLSCDFYVDPMGWVIGQTHGGDAGAVDEVVLPGRATTLEACREVLRRIPEREREVVVYGDASGNARLRAPGRRITRSSGRCSPRDSGA